ncbi:MAG: hypothetical protein OCD01_15515 [Fibrobacterales bacterium]
MNKKIILIVLAISVSLVFARKGPQKRALRALSMGNAFVAVAEDFNAVYYNPAGLNNMNKLGNYDKRPDLGYYPDNWLDFRPVTIRISTFDVLGLYNDIKGYYDKHGDTWTDVGGGGTEFTKLETVKNDTGLISDLYFIDGIPMGLGFQLSLVEMAFHNFGIGTWTSLDGSMFIDPGVIVPAAGVNQITAQAGAQVAMALEWPWHRNISIGLGFKAIAELVQEPFKLSMAEVDINNPGDSPAMDSLSERFNQVISDASQLTETVGYAIDIGAMYQFKRTIRFGLAIQDIYFSEFNEESVTPDVTLGVVWSPRKMQKNTAYARKINFACDLEDVINADRSYKPLSKINLGVEVEQVLLAIPSITMGSNWRALKGRLAGGFKGGYWTAGVGLEILRFVDIQVASWADEAGYFTGQQEDRKYAVEFGVGF